MANPLGEATSGLFGNLFSVSVVGIIVIVVVAIVAAFMYYFLVYRRKFNIDVKIISERANDDYIVWDKAAILKDFKNKTKYFKLRNTKIELEVPPFKILQTTSKGDYLELLRKSQDMFVFLTRPMIDKDKIIRADGKLWPIARLKHRQMEADYYWIVKRMMEDKSWIAPEGFLSKIIQMLPIIIPSFFMLIILFIFMDRLPEILGALSKVAESIGGGTGTVPAG